MLQQTQPKYPVLQNTIVLCYSLHWYNLKLILTNLQQFT